MNRRVDVTLAQAGLRHVQGHLQASFVIRFEFHPFKDS